MESRKKCNFVPKASESCYNEHGIFAAFAGPGARFSKVPIINGPGNLLPFTLKIAVSVVLHLT